MNLSEVSIENTTVDWNNCLQHWSWLFDETSEFTIWIVTKFAELLVIDDKGGVWFLSTSGASLEKVASSVDEFSETLNHSEKVDYYFMPSLIDALESEGITLSKNECYGFITPNVFKECTFEPNNFKVIGIENYLVGLGDMLGELINTPNGQEIQYRVVQ